MAGELSSISLQLESYQGQPRDAAKSIVLLTVTMKTSYNVCLFLFLRMDGLGDSTHKIIPIRKSSKLVPAAGSTVPIEIAAGAGSSPQMKT